MVKGSRYRGSWWLILGSSIIYYDCDIIYAPKINIQMCLFDLSLLKSLLLPTNSYCYTAYIMSSYLSKAGPVNLAENIFIIAPNKGFNALLELTPLKDEYKGLN